MPSVCQAWMAGFGREKGNKTKLMSNNLTGKVERTNTKLLKILLKEGFIPVICAPAISYEGEIINVDNDWATAMMVKDIKVEKLVVLFEAPGLLKDPNDENSLIRELRRDSIDEAFAFARGCMRKKVLGAKKAFEGRVKEIYWGDGRVKNPIQKALTGKGTVIK